MRKCPDSFYGGYTAAAFYWTLQEALQAVDAVCGLTAVEQLLAYAKVITDIRHKQPFLASLWQRTGRKLKVRAYGGK